MINAFVIEWKGPYTDPKEITENNFRAQQGRKTL